MAILISQVDNCWEKRTEEEAFYACHFFFIIIIPLESLISTRKGEACICSLTGFLCAWEQSELHSLLEFSIFVFSS